MNDQVSGLYKISSLQTLPGGPGRRCTLLGSPVASMRKVAAQGSPDLSSGPTPQSSTLVGAEPTEPALSSPGARSICWGIKLQRCLSRSELGELQLRFVSL